MSAHERPAALVLRSRGDRLSLRVERRAVLVGVVLGLLTLAVLLAAVGLGKYAVAPGDAIAAILGGGDGSVRMVVVEWRLPRALLAALFGAALGIGGAVFQSLTRNALGSPDVIGFTTGSYTGVVIVLLLGGTGFALTASGALAGGLVTALTVYLFAFKRGVQGFRLIVIGIAVSAMLGAFNTWALVKADVALAMQAAVWGAGTLNGVTWTEAVPSLLAMLVLCLGLTIAAPRLRQLELGDEHAALQGLAVERSKVALIALGVGFTALVTATAGPISFVALAAPQVAKRIARTQASVGLVTSALVGAVLLSAADLVAQHAVPGLSLPVGAVTVSIGGVYLIWLLARETKEKTA